MLIFKIRCIEDHVFLEPLIIIKVLKTHGDDLSLNLSVLIIGHIRYINILTSGFVPFFRNKFPGLFQDSKIHNNPFNPEISELILLTVCYTFHIFYFSLTDFQLFPGQVALFQDFPVLENATVKFQDFPGFPEPIQTL